MSNARTNDLGGPFTFPGTQLTVRRLGYGAMQLAGPGVYGPPKDPAAAEAVLRAAIAAGVTHIDTSDYYGPYVTNEIIKRTLHPYPRDLVLVTKLGARRTPDKAWLPAITPAELRQGVRDNLAHLGLEALDIVNYRVMGSGHGLEEGSVAEQIGTLADLQREGLVRHIGISNATRTQIAEARKLVDIVCVQNNYNLAHREDDALVDELARDGIAFVPFFPLGGFSPLQSSTLSAVATEAGATPLQVALAWLLQRSPNVLLIPGTSSVAHLEENLAAASLSLTPKMITTLNGIASKASGHGHALASARSPRATGRQPCHLIAVAKSRRVLTLIGALKLLKGGVLAALGVAILVRGPGLGASVRELVGALKVDPDNHRLHALVEKISGVPARTLHEIAFATFLYAAVFSTEGVGLLLRKRWAEWLTVVVTASLLPVEVYELAERLTLVRLAALLVNAAIVVFLIVNLRRERVDAPLSHTGELGH